MYYVYILECADGSFYTGITKNLESRLQAHNSGQGSRYTRGRLPVAYVYKEKSGDRSEASKREIEIKKYSRAKKLKLIGKAT